MPNFRIVENEYVPMDDIKKDWINGLRGNELRKKWGMSTRKYSRMLDELEADGYKTKHRRKKQSKTPKNVYYDVRTKRFTVKKMINGEYIYGGCFTKRCDAEQRVKELNENGWVV